MSKKKKKHVPEIDKIGMEFTENAISLFDVIIEENLTPDNDFDSYSDNMKDFSWKNIIGEDK